MKRWLTSLVGCTLVAAVALTGRGDESETEAAGQNDQPPQPSASSKRLSPLMQMKLERSKAVLEGLALEDFDKISANAQALRLLSLESGWNVLQTKEYATQSEDFRRTSKLISKAARDKDLGRATLGYVALTVRCVECHAYMREQLGNPVGDEAPAGGADSEAGASPESAAGPADGAE